MCVTGVVFLNRVFKLTFGTTTIAWNKQLLVVGLAGASLLPALSRSRCLCDGPSHRWPPTPGLFAFHYLYLLSSGSPRHEIPPESQIFTF